MVRIVKEQEAEKFSSKQVTVLNLLGVVIADKPDVIKQLLEKNGIEVTAKPTPKELSGKVIYGIEKLGDPFHKELAALIMKKVDDNNYDSFGPAVGAIGGVIGSVAGLFGKKQERKAMQEQARAQTMTAMLAYKAEQQRAAAQADIARQQANIAGQQNAGQQAMMKTVGTIAIIALIGFLLFTQLKKRQQSPQVAYINPNQQ